jgi:hypothetical protein
MLTGRTSPTAAPFVSLIGHSFLGLDHYRGGCVGFPKEYVLRVPRDGAATALVLIGLDHLWRPNRCNSATCLLTRREGSRRRFCQSHHQFETIYRPESRQFLDRTFSDVIKRSPPRRDGTKMVRFASAISRSRGDIKTLGLVAEVAILSAFSGVKGLSWLYEEAPPHEGRSGIKRFQWGRGPVVTTE